MEKITKDMTIHQALTINENLAAIFMGFGMFCVSCPSAQAETIEEAAMVHGIDADELLKALNEAI